MTRDWSKFLTTYFRLYLHLLDKNSWFTSSSRRRVLICSPVTDVLLASSFLLLCALQWMSTNLYICRVMQYIIQVYLSIDTKFPIVSTQVGHIKPLLHTLMPRQLYPIHFWYKKKGLIWQKDRGMKPINWELFTKVHQRQNGCLRSRGRFWCFR